MKTNRYKQWKTINGYDGYEVSNKGRVRNLNWNRNGEPKILNINQNPITGEGKGGH